MERRIRAGRRRVCNRSEGLICLLIQIINVFNRSTFSIMKNLIILLVFPFIVFSSCAKVDVKTEVPWLVGEWKWHYSIRTYDLYFNPPYSHQTVQTDSDYRIKITKNGRIKLYEEGKQISSEWIWEADSDPSYFGFTPFDNYSSISFHLKDEHDHWSGYVSEDSLKIWGNYPFEFDQGNSYKNFFYKVD